MLEHRRKYAAYRYRNDAEFNHIVDKLREYERRAPHKELELALEYARYLNIEHRAHPYRTVIESTPRTPEESYERQQFLDAIGFPGGRPEHESYCSWK